MAPSLRPEHVVAAAAYVVGYPVLLQIVFHLEVFDFLLPVHTVGELMAMRIPIPPGFDWEQTVGYALCVASPMCEVTAAAYAFLPLAVVSGALRSRVPRPSAAPGESMELPFILTLLACLVLVTGFNLLLPPLVPTGGVFTYGERWAHLPVVSVIQHIGYALAAYLAARHWVCRHAPSSSQGLLDAVRAGNVEALLELLGAGADVNEVRDDDGATLLHVAVASGDVEVVRTLLAGEADPNATDGAGDSPLHIAAHRGDTGAIVVLVAQGADADARDAQGGTALHRAASRGHGEAVASLLELGADPALTDGAGRSALALWSGPRDEAFKRLSAASGAQAVE